jgi:hypothetical protein
LILPDFILPSRVNQCWQYSGIDSYEDCKDKRHFEAYPYTVEYQYNSRGYRDQEWPDSVEELKNSIWCIGDSFTVGLGSPINHTWPWLLQQQTKLRTINVSMDGASNNWIARKTIDILQKIKPQHIVIHWSYIHRREANYDSVYNTFWSQFYQAVRDSTWPASCSLDQIDNLPTNVKHELLTWPEPWPTVDDEDLRLFNQPDATNDDDLVNTLNCINAVNRASADTKIIHSFIPDFCENSQQVQQQLSLSLQHIYHISEFKKLDLARDGHHYDIKTSQVFVNQIIAQIDAQTLSEL